MADLPFDNLQCMILSKSYEGLTPQVPGALDLFDFLDAIFSARLQERIQGRLRSGDNAAGCSLIDTGGKIFPLGKMVHQRNRNLEAASVNWERQRIRSVTGVEFRS